MDFFDVVTTQRAMRRLKTDAIPDAVLQKIMDAAICAPSGGNRQNWSFVVVRDRAKRGRLGELYREAWGELMKVPYYAGASKEPADSPAGKMLGSARHLARRCLARRGRAAYAQLHTILAGELLMNRRQGARAQVDFSVSALVNGHRHRCRAIDPRTPHRCREDRRRRRCW